MSWNRLDIAGPKGVQVMLRKLEESPLVRKKLPNTAAVAQQYFNYRRNPGESISSYLVRETLFFEEFFEALQDLQQGDSGSLLLDELLGQEDEDEDESSQGDSPKSSKSKSKGYSRVPQEDPDPPAGDQGSRTGRTRPPRTSTPTLSSTDSSVTPLAQAVSVQAVSQFIIALWDSRCLFVSFDCV